jgi:hypothetical protein
MEREWGMRYRDFRESQDDAWSDLIGRVLRGDDIWGAGSSNSTDKKPNKEPNKDKSSQNRSRAQELLDKARDKKTSEPNFSSATRTAASNKSKSSDSTDQGTATTDTSTGKQRRIDNYVSPKEMASYLANKGLDKNSIAGLLANAKGESSFNSGVYIPRDGNEGQGGGLFGFHDPKDGRGEFTNMVRYCGANWHGNWQGQLDYALKASRYPKKGFATPAAATEWFLRHYEKPRYPERDLDRRIKFANNLIANSFAK